LLRKENSVRRALVTCTVLALALLGGCGGGPGGPTAGPTSSQLLGPNDTVFCGVFDTGTVVEIKNNAFIPADVTIAVNGEVDWKNEDQTTHVIKFDNGTTCGTVMAGQTKKVRFSAAGLYPYHCTIHPDMKGNVLVQ
jgi:plastocyanin